MHWGKQSSTPILPWDSHNQRLISNVRPPDWKNPAPASRYNLIVIGAGPAGLVTAAGAAALGAKVALIEKRLMGGDCLNAGCVPSKALLRAARALASIREAAEFGIQVPSGATVDFAQLMGRMRRLRADISLNDSAKRFTELGVDVFLGAGRFTGPDMVEVSGQALRFAKAVIATGTHPAIPPIPGLKDVSYLTNETIFSLTELPKRLGIIGAGPIGCEMAQAFARFGSEVFLVEAEHCVLPREDPDASEIVRAALARDGVKLFLCARKLSLAQAVTGTRLQLQAHSTGHDLEVDKLLVAVGRAPNVEGLGLEKADIELDQKGVKVNARLQTTNPRIYAAGDVCSSFQFTHAADFQARAVLQNALFKGRTRAPTLIIPWCTCTSPEVAHVGLSEKEARTKGVAVDTFTQELAQVDRAVLDGQTEGFVRVHVRKGTDEILGATIVASHAGDLISEITLAMKNRIGLRKIARTIHPYPTQAEAIRKTGDAYSRTRLTPLVKTILGHWLAWQRGWAAKMNPQGLV